MAMILPKSFRIAIELPYFPMGGMCLHCILWQRASGFGVDWACLKNFRSNNGEPNVILNVAETIPVPPEEPEKRWRTETF